MVIGKVVLALCINAKLNKIDWKTNCFYINIIEIKQPDLDAVLVKELLIVGNVLLSVIAQKQAINVLLELKETQVSGRLNGADIAYAEGYSGRNSSTSHITSREYRLRLGRSRYYATVNLIVKSMESTVVKFFQLVKTLKR